MVPAQCLSGISAITLLCLPLSGGDTQTLAPDERVMGRVGGRLQTEQTGVCVCVCVCVSFFLSFFLSLVDECRCALVC